MPGWYLARMEKRQPRSPGMERVTRTDEDKQSQQAWVKRWGLHAERNNDKELSDQTCFKTTNSKSECTWWLTADSRKVTKHAAQSCFSSRRLIFTSCDALMSVLYLFPSELAVSKGLLHEMWQKHGGGLHGLCHQPLTGPSYWQLWAPAVTTGEHCDTVCLCMYIYIYI